jgi:hypothetical protein
MPEVPLSPSALPSTAEPGIPTSKNPIASDGITFEKDMTNKSGDTPPPDPGPIVQVIKNNFEKAKSARFIYEQKWIQSVRNYRGEYGPDTQFTDTEKSRVFIKITKTKVVAAFGQVIEVLFGTSKFPITIEPSTLPEGIAESVTVKTSNEPPSDLKLTESPYGYPGDGKDLVPGQVPQLDRLLGPSLSEQLDPIQDKIEAGASSNPNDITINPADIAAKKMEKTILDQLDGSDASVHLRHTAFEMVLLGTGILKGPLTSELTLHKWDKTEDGSMQYEPIYKMTPKVQSTSVWNFYPDPDGISSTDLEWAIERHGMSRTQLRDLGRRPMFKKNVINYILNQFTPNYVKESWESILYDHNRSQEPERYEVLEYWGYIDRKVAEDFGITIPKYLMTKDYVQANVWLCCDQIIRMVLNPFIPNRIPYLIAPYEINPYQIWGVGVPENMADSQIVMNGHARMAIDNLALAGNVVFEVDETYLAPGEDLKIYPGRIFRRSGGPPGQSIFATKFPNTATENLAMFDKFRQLADESTGIPSYSHGQTGVSGTTRTASGMSMLMGASSLNIKTVIKNIDDYLIKPLGESMFAWNMQFNKDLEIRGDLEVRARGTSSLMAKEVRSQRLMMFMQVAGNPALAPFVKWNTVLREIAKSLEIDPDKFVNNIDEAKVQALIHQAAGGVGGQGESGANAPAAAGSAGPGGMGSGAGGISPTDSQGSGGGTVGTGAVSQPGEISFTGNSQ